jgi:hypothetical protein
MATIKLTIDKRRPFNDGRIPVIFRITNNKKSTSIISGVKIIPNEWDTNKCKIVKQHPKSKELNILLSKRLIELENKLLEVSSTADDISVHDLKKALLNDNKPLKIKFSDFALAEISNLEEKNKFSNAKAYETAANRLVGYAGAELTLDKVTFSLLSDFETHLIKNGLTRNSVAVYMREIRAILNKAIKKKFLSREQYPFTDYKIKTEKTVNRPISQSELLTVKQYPLEEGTRLWHSRNMFLLIFNLIGISFIDLSLLKHSSIQSDRVLYRRRKTGKIYSIKLTDEAKRIINLYKNENSEFLISYTAIDGIPKEKERDAIALNLKTCNKYLKRLGKLCELPIPLTTYVARYTWANIAKTLGYPKDQIAEALGHEYGNRVTGIYLDSYGNEVIDEMNEQVTKI